MSKAAVLEGTQEAPVASVSENGHAPAGFAVAGSLDDILGIEDTRYEVVPVPEWGLSIRLVSLSGHDRNRVALAARAHRKTRPSEDEAVYFQARIILASMVDEAGEHIGEQSKAPALMAKNGAALTRLYLAAGRLSGIGSEAEDEAVEDLKGTPSADTGSD